MALGAGHEAQLVGVYPLDGGTGFLRHCGIVSGHSRGHALGQQHRIHAGAALQKLRDRVLAVDEALVPGLVVGLFAAGTAGILRSSMTFSFRFYRRTPKPFRPGVIVSLQASFQDRSAVKLHFAAGTDAFQTYSAYNSS